MASYIGNKEIVSMYLGNSNVASFSFGNQEIWTPGGDTPPEPTLKEFIGFGQLGSSALNIPSETPATIIITYRDPKDNIDSPILTIDNYGDIVLSVTTYYGDIYVDNFGYVYDFEFEYNGSIYNADGYLASDLNSFTLLGIYNEGDWSDNLLDINPVQFIPEEVEE